MASTNKCTTDFEARNELICMANNKSYRSHFTIFLQPASEHQRASTSERAGSILFFAYGKNRAFPLECVFSPLPSRARYSVYGYNITIFGVQNGICCVLVFVLDLKGKLTTYIMITFKPIFCSMLLNNM